MSINLDKSNDFNSFPKQNSIENIKYKKQISESVLELKEQGNDNTINDYVKNNDKVSDVFISKDNLDFFDIIDKSFTHFLINLSYEINLELFKINILKKVISEDNFKFLSNNNYIIKHPYPFVISYDLNQNLLSFKNNKPSNIHLFNITTVELEFYNLKLSLCKNNINQLKNRFRLLNKKHRYWRQRLLNLNN